MHQPNRISFRGSVMNYTNSPKISILEKSSQVQTYNKRKLHSCLFNCQSTCYTRKNPDLRQKIKLVLGLDTVMTQICVTKECTQTGSVAGNALGIGYPNLHLPIYAGVMAQISKRFCK